MVVAASILLIAVGNVFLSTVSYGNKTLSGNVDQIQKDLGSTPIFFEGKSGLPLDNKTHVVFLYYTPCPTCDDGQNLFITKSFPTWQGNLTDRDVSFDLINYFRKKDVGEAYFETFKIKKSQYGGSVLVIHNSKIGLVHYPPFNDENIQKGTYYLAKGSLVESFQKKNEVRFSQPLVYALGAVSGFNPCLIALASFFFATATKTELGGVAKRIAMISLGLIYAYILLFSLIVSNPAVMTSLTSLTWVIALALVAMGVLHFAEVAQDLYSRRWGSGSSIEAKIPLFRTPTFLKNLLAKIREQNSPAYDFVLGAVFSLIKLPCIAVFLVVLLINSASPLMDVIIFTLGVASPIILMGLFIGLGMIKVNRLSTAQFEGRLIQRIIIGSALLISAFLVVM